MLRVASNDDTSVLPGNQEHLAAPSRQRAIGPAVIGRLHNQPVAREDLGEVRGRVETNPVFAFAGRATPAPCRAHRQDAGQYVERPLMPDHRMIVREPPVAIEKAAHDAIAIPAVPDERATWLEHARPFSHDALVITWEQKESERREQVDYGVETRAPTRRERSHVAARVAKRWPRSPLACAIQQLSRKVEPIDVESSFRQQMRVTSLPAWDVEHARSGGKPQQVEEPRNFMAIAREIEDGLVLEQVMRVELVSPPVGSRESRIGSRGGPCSFRFSTPRGRADFRFPIPDSRFPAQKNTGSRYAPNTVSMAARIS